MSTTLFHLVISALLLSCLTAHADTPLYEATYKGKYGSLKVTMVRSLYKTEGNQYQLNSTAKAFAGNIVETSTFEVTTTTTSNTLTPLRYDYKRKIFGVKKEESLTFDWEKTIGHYQKGKKERRERPIVAGSLDPTLYQLQMQRDITQNPEAKSLSYTFARRSQTKTYQFERQAKEEVRVDGKTYKTLVFARTDDKDKETRFWVVPALDYAIARIRHSEDGDSYEVQLISYNSSPSFREFLAPKQP